MVKTINSKNFRPYGRVIEYPKKHLKSNKRNFFRIVLTENNRYSWRIAYLIVRDKTISRLEYHPHSFESFEPLHGQNFLYVAKDKNVQLIECFSLGKPILLNKEIWHGVVTVTDETEIKLTENAKVHCVYWSLGFKLPLNKKLGHFNE